MLAAGRPGVQGLERGDDGTRRRFLAGAVSIVALGLAGCGDDEPDAAAAEVAPTREFVDSLGVSTLIPDRPTRIVCVRDLEAARLLALGAPVVALPPLGDDFRPEVRDLFDLDGVTPLAGDLDLELVASLRPDLIVADSYKGEGYEAPVMAGLREIAPVVTLETFQTVEEATEQAATLLGASATVEVSELRDDFEAALQELRDVLGDRWAEVTTGVVRFDGPATPLYVWSEDSVPLSDVLDRLGVGWIDYVAEAGRNGGDVELSLENVGGLECDLLFVVTAFLADDAPQPEDVPVFEALTVQQQGQVVKVDASYFGVTYPTYAALARLVVEALRGVEPIDTGLV